jgi:Transglycosylase SLT domain
MTTWYGFLARFIVTIALALNVIFVVNHIHSPLVITKVVAMTNATAEQAAQEIMTPRQYKCLVGVITIESHDNPLAKSPTSSAKGVGQLLASTYRNLGLKYSNDPKAQLIAMLAYISERYGSGGACAALRNEHRYNYF